MKMIMIVDDNIKDVTIFCNKLISNSFNVEDIKVNFDKLVSVAIDLFQEPEGLNGDYDFVATGIFIDDILSDNRISKDQQDTEILDLINTYLLDIQRLAKKTIIEVTKLEKKLEKEAEERGYCSRLIDKDK